MAGEHVKRLIAAGRKHPNEPMHMSAQAERDGRERIALDLLRGLHMLADVEVYQGRREPGKN